MNGVMLNSTEVDGALFPGQMQDITWSMVETLHINGPFRPVGVASKQLCGGGMPPAVEGSLWAVLATRMNASGRSKPYLDKPTIEYCSLRSQCNSERTPKWWNAESI